MHRLGFPVNHLKTGYLTCIRPILEYACPVRGPQTHYIEYLSDDVEGLKKRAVTLILGENFVDYKSALEFLKVGTVKGCRFQLIMRFGQFLPASPKHRHTLP